MKTRVLHKFLTITLASVLTISSLGIGGISQVAAATPEGQEGWIESTSGLTDTGYALSTSSYTINAISPSGKYIVYQSGTGNSAKFYVEDSVTKERRLLQPRSGGIFSKAIFDPNESKLAIFFDNSVNTESEVTIYDLSTTGYPELVGRDVNGSKGTGGAFTPDGSKLIYMHYNKSSVYVYDFATKKKQAHASGAALTSSVRVADGSGGAFFTASNPTRIIHMSSDQTFTDVYTAPDGHTLTLFEQQATDSPLIVVNNGNNYSVGTLTLSGDFTAAYTSTGIRPSWANLEKGLIVSGNQVINIETEERVRMTSPVFNLAMDRVALGGKVYSVGDLFSEEYKSFDPKVFEFVAQADGTYRVFVSGSPYTANVVIKENGTEI